MADFDWDKKRNITRGPFSFFNDTMIFESMEVETSQATALLRITYKGNDPLLKKGQFSALKDFYLEGRGHPLVPPLHLHFKQTETFKVLQGEIALITGYEEKEVFVRQGDEPFDVPPRLPHTPYCYGGDEDTIVLIRAHPAADEDPLGALFFEHLFKHLDEAFEAKKSPDVVQVMVMQHATDSALVMFPSATFLGSLRWRIPWLLQASVAQIGSWCGYTPEIKKYMLDEKKE